jgi:hypothetical protein
MLEDSRWGAGLACACCAGRCAGRRPREACCAFRVCGAVQVVLPLGTAPSQRNGAQAELNARYGASARRLRAQAQRKRGSGGMRGAAQA